jgi:membrane protein
MVYASAIAFRAVISLVPLVLLGLGVLGALGLKSVWRDTIGPAIRDRVTQAVYHGIDSSVEKILSSGTAGLIAFAAVLLLWDLSLAITVVMESLNRIHDVEERRSRWRRAVVAGGLAAVVAVCLVGSVLVVATLGRVGAGGGVEALLAIVKWTAAFALLSLAVALIVRSAPAEHPEPRWASAGSLLIVGTWIAATLLFRSWVVYVANFRSATGQLSVFLILTAWIFVGSTIFLVGAELDELMRKRRK